MNPGGQEGLQKGDKIGTITLLKKVLKKGAVQP
jgi:hypothetical protein